MSDSGEDTHTFTFPEVVEADAALARAVGGGDLGSDQADEAESLVDRAARAGMVTWDAAERSELRRVISNWVSLLDRVGRDTEIPELLSFAGDLPSTDPMDPAEMLAHVREERPIIAARVEGADLRGLDGMSGLRIVDSIFVDCNFDGVESRQARILHSSLKDCSFRDAVLPNLVATSSVFSGGSMARAISPEATFSGTRFERVVMEGCDFTQTSFGASILFEISAPGATLHDCLFDLTNIRRCEFRGADLARAIFAGATVQENSFRAADLTLAIFSGSDVRGSSFAGATIDRTYFAKAIDIALAEFDPGAAEVAEFAETDSEQLRSTALG
jgi:uncharacterized protein YjbI with pentapeptide repeats